MLEDCQDLDLRRGVLTRRRLVRDNLGHITQITHRRFVPMGAAHLAALEMTIVPRWSGRLHVRSELDGTVTNSGVPRYRELASRHLVPVEECKGPPGSCPSALVAYARKRCDQGDEGKAPGLT